MQQRFMLYPSLNGAGYDHCLRYLDLSEKQITAMDDVAPLDMPINDFYKSNKRNLYHDFYKSNKRNLYLDYFW